MSILAIIPSRKDSKRCSGKNIRQLYNIPLIMWTIENIYQLRKNFNKICIASDIKEILTFESNWFDVIKLPSNLTKEIFNSGLNEFGFINYCLEWYKKKGITFDDVAILYSTTPFKRSKTLIKIFKQWEKDRQWANQLRTVKEIRWEPEKIWYDYGISLYNFRSIVCNTNMQHHKQVPYCYIYKVDQLDEDIHYFYQPISKFVINDPIESHDINTEHDFWIAEKVIEDGLNE